MRFSQTDMHGVERSFLSQSFKEMNLKSPPHALLISQMQNKIKTCDLKRWQSNKVEKVWVPETT